MAVIVCLLGLFVVGLVPRLRQAQRLSAATGKISQGARQVAVIRARPAPPEELVLPGTTLALHDAVIGARATGYITSRFVDIGYHVHAGQVLAIISSPDVDAQLGQARAQATQSQAVVQQSQAVVQQSRAVVQQSDAKVKQTQASLNSARARLVQLEAAVKTGKAHVLEAQQQVSIKQAA